MTPLLAQFEKTQPPRNQAEIKSRWHSLRSSVLRYMRMCFLELRFSLFWSLSLTCSTFDSVTKTCCTTIHMKFHGILATFCPMTYAMTFNKLNSTRHVAGTKYPPNWCCTIIKVSVHMRGHVTATYPWDMYPQHFHAVILSLLPVPLHIPATCHLGVYYTSSFLLLQHVAATCPCLPTLSTTS